ncbi:Asp23/Gls24 family envelope stress response protein [Klenkia sp. PcliD-1-E]|uniref:Asp23/Gls24 family envelope stress response protein n=1 Tax=Klenkia sp. PcliD-1-E TaxID=2954492 RepID=UPI0020975AA4|nr:Asp23/Gls24 family envelope stress response protein [Klenkia sp. PcliD-1-E]MCO7218355.1 Asp23/Gls24 family envelope stress response protein [Klenkia sp. PcliD-1-E]
MSTPTDPTTTTGKGASKPSTELVSTQGKTTIADTVVSKIAGMAAREVNGVHRLGGGTARAFGAIRERIPGSGGANVSQGVSVEVGETQAAIDIDVVVEYGVAIADLAAGIRRNVISNLQQMTGLEVVEVNIAVDDIHLPTDDAATEDEQQPSRVQ